MGIGINANGRGPKTGHTRTRCPPSIREKLPMKVITLSNGTSQFTTTTMRTSFRSPTTMLRPLLVLILLLASSEAFPRGGGRRASSLAGALHPSSSHKTRRIPISFSTALKQASIAPPLEESDDYPSLVRKIRSRRPFFRADHSPKQQQQGSFLQRHPFVSAVMITMLNALCADLLTQLVFEATSWNRKRSALFAAFGFLYQGCAQYAIVNWGWERLFPGTTPRNVISKICGMNLLSDPLLFMPTFYIFREFMVQGTLTWSVVMAALGSYQANAWVDWRNSWMVWFPGHAVTYGVMPTHKRIPWMAGLSFFYMCVLSLTRGG